MFFRYRYLLILDLEGKEEIVEFPITVLDCEKKIEKARFHHFVRPTAWVDNIQNNLSNETTDKAEHVNEKSVAVPFTKVSKKYITGVLCDVPKSLTCLI